MSESPRNLPPVSGQQRLGPYLLGRKLGEGGMGVVYLGHDPTLQRDVAIKVLSVPRKRSERAMQRFIREAQSAAKLSHPNTVTIYHVGRQTLSLSGSQTVPAGAGAGGLGAAIGAAAGTLTAVNSNEGPGEQLYLVMELLEGGSLADRLETKGPMPWREAARAIRDAAAGLAAAHEAGLIHRDVKPSNLMLDRNGQIKVGDFGLARAQTQIQNDEGALTVNGMLIGTPAYMSPEQCSCDNVDARSDIYSLGCTFYALLTGRQPFEADDAPDLIYKHLHDPMPDPRTLAEDIPPSICELLRRSTRKLPRDRFQSCREMMAALDVLLEDRAGSASPTAPLSVAGSVKTGEEEAQYITPRAAAKPTRSVPNNLPVQLTSFIGRQRELSETKRLLTVTRLLTLTGPGGTGKTRLGLKAASESMDEFPDGVWFADLASLSDPNLVPQKIAAAASVREQVNESSLSALLGALRDKRALIILDNCEHLVSGCASAAESLLRGCPLVRILASSRERLDVPGETILRVPSLSLPSALAGNAGAGGSGSFGGTFTSSYGSSHGSSYESAHIPRGLTPGAAPGSADASRHDNLFKGTQDSGSFVSQSGSSETFNGCTAEAIANYEAVSLFVDRAAAAKPGFALDDENAPSVARICVRLDGIPLALELAAARVRVMTPQQIAERLGDRFRLLTGGSRTALPRQKTLKALIDWSYGLLDEQEKTLLRRLTVFAGGWSLEAAEEICAGMSIDGAADTIESFDVLDLLTHLVDKSLVLVDEQAGQVQRNRLLESIRQYAHEKLHESPQSAREAAAVIERHRGWYVGFAARAAPELLGPGQGNWLRRLDVEHDNLRLAMDVALHTGAYDDALSLVGSLWRYWYMRGNLLEGSSRIEAILSMPMPEEAKKTPAYALALGGWSVLVFYRGMRDESWEIAQRSNALSRASGDLVGTAFSLNHLGNISRMRGQFAQARAFYEEALALRRQLKDSWWTANMISNLACLAQEEGDLETAQKYFEENMVFRRDFGDQSGIAYCLYNLGELHLNKNDPATAEPMLEQSRQLLADLDDEWGVAYAEDALARVKIALGQPGARALIERTFATLRRLGDKGRAAMAAWSLAQVEATEGNTLAARELLSYSLTAHIECEEALGIAKSLEGFALVAVQLARESEKEQAKAQEKPADGPEQNASSPRATTARNVPPPFAPSHWAAVALRLISAAQKIRGNVKAPVLPIDEIEHKRLLAYVEPLLTPQAAEEIRHQSPELEPRQVAEQSGLFIARQANP